MKKSKVEKEKEAIDKMKNEISNEINSDYSLKDKNKKLTFEIK